MPVDERVARSVALEQAYVHDVYEQFYDNPRSKPWPKIQQFLQDLEPGSLVCDVGCGNGKYLNANTSIFNVGADKSMRMTEVAREKENEVIVLDNLALPYRDESLDAVLSIAVVHHLATTERRVCALRELARVLRIGGKLIISVWAMEQSHRKFESQDVLVPWHRPNHLSTPSLELTSTTNTSEDDCMPPYHAYTQTSDSDSNRSIKSRGLNRKRGKNRHKGRSIDPGRNSSPSSSSLSSPNETCYSFVRRAIQKLAGGKRVGVYRPWFLDSWSTCAKEPFRNQRYDHDGCECCEYNENIQDLPIELRRVDEEDLPQRRQTFPSSQLINDIASNLKSRSLTNMKTAEDNNATDAEEVLEGSADQPPQSGSAQMVTLAKPKLVKQKKSICEEDDDEALDQPTDMKTLISNLPDFKVFNGRYHKGGVLKQRSLNEELMSTDRLKEKERVRQNIQKQASLNEDLIYQRHHAAFDSFKDSFFSVSTSKRFQLIKTGFTNKIKSSTTNIERVTGGSLKNGFVRMFQHWKSSEMISPTIPENEAVDSSTRKASSSATTPVAAAGDDKREEGVGERRHSKEDGSDSSKDSSLQSDTSVDSEDSFASVIFVPKSDPMSPTPLSPGPVSPRLLKNASMPNSPRIKQSSCPTSPRIKQMPLTIYPQLTKQLSSPKPTTNAADLLLPPTPTAAPTAQAQDKSDRDHSTSSTDSTTVTSAASAVSSAQGIGRSLAQKYTVQQIPRFRPTSENSPAPSTSISISTSASTSTGASTSIGTSNGTGPSTSTSNGTGTSASIAAASAPTTSTSTSVVVSPEISPVAAETRTERLKKIKELLTQKPGFGVRASRSHFPIVRHSSVSNGKVEAIAKPLPKLMTLELFNPETDDKDSDSSCVSSPESIDSVINVRTTDESFKYLKFKFPPPKASDPPKKSLLEAAADVASTLDEAVGRVIKSSPRSKRKLHSSDVLSVIHRRYSTDTTPLLGDDAVADCSPTWDAECHKHLTDFADKLSEKLLAEIDQYQEKSKDRLSHCIDNIDDPYIHRLSEELDDLSKLSAEIQKQNEYLAKLSASDSLFVGSCSSSKQCKRCSRDVGKCKCRERTKAKTKEPKVAVERKGGGAGGASNVTTQQHGEAATAGASGTAGTSGASGSSGSSSAGRSGEVFTKSLTNDSLSANSSEKSEAKPPDPDGKLAVAGRTIKLGTSTDSCDSEKGSSTNSMISSAATSINFGPSVESADGLSDRYSGESHKDSNSISRYSDGGSTASLASCPEWKTIKSKTEERLMSKDSSSISLESDSLRRRCNGDKDKSSLYSDTSQDSLPSDNVGGEITYHRYYHVFREGELDQLIEKYVENLHIISSYYDHASWCIIAEKVQVWTI